MKKILGLDLGTNSIGWALIENNFNDKKGNIIGMGSRIIPMSQDAISDFGKGNSISQTAERTEYRGVRRLQQRSLLRRERLHRVLNIMGFLPEHYSKAIDFEKRKGQFFNEDKVKLPYINDNGRNKFLFLHSFNEMLDEFKKIDNEINNLPFDWTIYFLRKKALEQSITKQELAWIILNFNQKRGYYQLREDQEEEKDKTIEFHALKVKNVTAEEQNNKKEIWYNVILENDWIYKRKSKTPLFDWIGKTKEFIVTTALEKNGEIKKDKYGNVKRSFRAPKEDDWTLVKKKTESDLFEYNKNHNTVGVANYIFNRLLTNPTIKIKGGLIKTIERKYYKEELHAILEKQKEFHSELRDKNLLKKCAQELYSQNIAQYNILVSQDFTNLFINDIIFYQRPLKTKKSLIGGCSFENRTYKNNQGELITVPVKAIAKSNPFFQEFRLWQFISNLKLYKREGFDNNRKVTDLNVTDIFLKTEEDYETLFDSLNDKKEIDQKTLLKFFIDNNGKKLSEKEYRWNYVEEKKYPCNETRAAFIAKFKKIKSFDWKSFLTKENEQKLWHIFYSISDKNELDKMLENDNFKLDIPIEVRRELKKLHPFVKDYGSYSEKAIKKLLPLMRMGKYWNEDNISSEIKTRIQKFIDGEFDEKIGNRAREKAIKLNTIKNFKALPRWLASYIVYDRHAEEGEIKHWSTPEKIEFLKQHSLRNPVVEQIVNETLRVVKDIWKHYGNGKEKYFDEIHVELGRDMKNPAEKRKNITQNILKNQDTNQRIKNILRELKNQGVDNVTPYSPSQQEILKIFEEGILQSVENIPDDIEKISKNPEPTSKEIEKYKLWLEQKYLSPYTGSIIPLSELFTPKYEIEHVLPQSRYFDNSIANKVICESEVNKLKDNKTGYEFILKHGGAIVDVGQGKNVTVFNKKEYEQHISYYYKKGGKKAKILLSEDIPEKFIERQLNDSRYISKVVKNLLSNIVREKDEQETTAKNLISVTGSVTSILKNDWGLNDVWNELIKPRFIRLNEMTNSNQYGYYDNKDGKRFFRIQVPQEIEKGFNKKRIDHRHHAMDALIVACATRNHINYLSNRHANQKEARFDLRNKLRRIEEKQYPKNENGKKIYKTRKVAKEFIKPWPSFTVDTKNELNKIIISFKQNIRVINKTTNQYTKWNNSNGVLKKELFKQKKGDNWAIRKPLHKETVSGRVSLRFTKTVPLNTALKNWKAIVDKELKSIINKLINKGYDYDLLKRYFKSISYKINEKDVSKVLVYYYDDNYTATRKPIDSKFTSKTINSVCNSMVKKILLNHLEKYNTTKNDKIVEHPDLAFSPEGIDEMNKHLKIPIYKVRIAEPTGKKFAVGYKGNRKNKYVEAAKGTNLFFAIYSDSNGNRTYESIPLNIVIERQKQGLTSVPEIDAMGNNLLFTLSPNDLVYVPSEEEMDDLQNINIQELAKTNVNKVYKMISSSGFQCFFLRNDIAISIVNKKEFSALNKMEKDISNIMIKKVCIKIKNNRIGNVSI